jgi:hypothetical protein
MLWRAGWIAADASFDPWLAAENSEAGLPRQIAHSAMTPWPTLQKELPLDQQTGRQITAYMESVPLLAQIAFVGLFVV